MRLVSAKFFNSQIIMCDLKHAGTSQIEHGAHRKISCQSRKNNF